ncbi:MAG TPA: type I polyketide synthase, partial [Acidimicrobiales bacterium]|nr:type I polyketide synthase [Acidimicrobiales bacterium]
MSDEDAGVADSDLAIIGMSGRFPGAATADALWMRIAAGDDCLRDLRADELRDAGVPSHLLESPDYVLRGGSIDDVDRFDPGFFGIGPRDAAIMDPQHRQLLECAWEALEAGCQVPERFAGTIGVFAGCGANTYLLNNLLANPTLVEQVGWFLLRHTGNDKDFLATGISYRLDLRGPSVNVQTACSTSLVALHLAVQSLLAFECDMAIAGGATIEVPHGVGYRYHEGEILSPDGRCRAFDAASRGTVLTSGAGALALRRAADAVRDGDPILAIIKGSAVNNDGSRKVGYLAPSVDGHADVVREALAVAGVDARTISLLEAHGTGTEVGDPIEFAALTEAFRAHTSDVGFCRLGSIKPNIGHLDTAAGVASVIKVVQAMRHRWLPPLANHTAPSPLLPLAASPFEISGAGQEWTSAGPRRAGVSSLGVGGTNAHVILEEAPSLPAIAPAPAEQLLALSARSAGALDEASERLASFLETNPHVSLADVAYTLAVGRRRFAHRRVVVATDVADAIVQLRGADRRRTYRAIADERAPDVALLLPGGGTQYPGMAAGLDDRFDVFHRVLHEGIGIVKAQTGLDLAPLLKPDADPDALRLPTASLPAVFVIEVALARQWIEWGVRTQVLVGHSLGEYAAAHLAGVMSYADALRLVTTRAALMERVAADAAMLVVPLPADEVRVRLPDTLSLAVINAHDECVVSGHTGDIDSLAQALESDGVSCTRIPLAAAAHSFVLDPILSDFASVARTVTFSPPSLRYVSNLTGTWADAGQVVNPQYWVDHLRKTVRFEEDLATAIAAGPLVLVETGPGQALSSYARRQTEKAVAIVSTLRHPNDEMDDAVHLLAAAGRVWAHGGAIEIERLVGGTGPRRRLTLPTYPFQRERYWIEPATVAGGLLGAPVPRDAASQPSPPAPETSATLTRIARLEDWAWRPGWRETEPPPHHAKPVGPWIVVADPGDPFATRVADGLRARGEVVHALTALDQSGAADAEAIVLVAPAVPCPLSDPAAMFERARARLLREASDAARRLATRPSGGRLVVITRSALDAAGPADRPTDALALGPVLVAPKEYPEVQAVLVDLDATPGDADLDAVLDEITSPTDPVVAWRARRRFVPSRTRHGLEPAPSTAAAFRPGGTYVVTGALGGVGHVLATHLATVHRATLVVLTSEALPPASERARFLAGHGTAHPTSQRLRRLAALEALGGRVVTMHADVSDPAAVRAALDEAERAVGPIHGAVHAAGRLVDRLIETVTDDEHEAVVGAKARGAIVLADELARRNAKLLVLVASTSTVLAPAGQSSYVAANAVLDAMVGTRLGLRVVAIDFGVWAGTGMAAEAARRSRLGLTDGASIRHPVLVERRVDRTGAVELIGTLHAASDWLADEHRVGSGTAVLPGTGHLELMLAALREAGVAPALRDVSLLEPLVIPADRAVTVRAVVGPPDPTGTRLVAVHSDGGGGDWRLHSEAAVPATVHDVPVELLAWGAQRAACHREVDLLAGQRRHLQLGPRWDAVVEATAGDDVVVAHLRLPAAIAAEAEHWLAHPALVDVATGCGVALGADDGSLYVPVGYHEVRWHAPVPAEVFVIARRRESHGAAMLRVDLTLSDANGAVVLEIDGMSLHPVAANDVARLESAEPLEPMPVVADIAPLLALAADLGIEPSDGAELLERAVASGIPRLIVSSV